MKTNFSKAVDPIFLHVLEPQAELWRTRGGLCVKVPSLPSPLFKQPDSVLKAMASANDSPTPICNFSTMKTNEAKSIRIASSQRDQFKIISVAFLKGLKCNYREFNEVAEGDCKLVTWYATMTATHPLISSRPKALAVPFLFWSALTPNTVNHPRLTQVRLTRCWIRRAHFSAECGTVTPLRFALQPIQRL